MAKRKNKKTKAKKHAPKRKTSLKKKKEAKKDLPEEKDATMEEESKETEESEEIEEASSSAPDGAMDDKEEIEETEEQEDEVVEEAATEQSPEDKKAAKKKTKIPTLAGRPTEKESVKDKPEKEEKKKWFSFKRKKKNDDDVAVKPKKKKKESSLAAALTSLNNIGMGKQVNLFVQSVATMLNAGLSLLDSLRIFQKEVRGRAMKKIMQKMIESVEAGTPFWRAMSEQHLFTQYDVAMIRIGEDAGNLARNVQYLAEQREKDRSLRQKVKMAMVYPTIVMVMMFIIVMGLGLFVLPNLVLVLFSLNVDLPATTRAVIYVTNIFSEHGKVFVPAILVLMVLVFLLAKFTRFKAVTQWVVFKIPGIGRLAREATVARFGVILGGLLQAGVPFVEALESLTEVTQVVAYKKFYQDLLDHIQVGDSFSTAFEEIKASKKLLPVSVQQLVVTGERSGSLADSLLKVAHIYEKKASETAEMLPVILEPTILLIIGGLVGLIAFAIIVPIYSVVGSVGGS